MEKIDIIELLNYVKNKLLIILMGAIVGLILGLGYKFIIEKPKYKSTTTLILVGFNNSTNKIDSNELAINQRLIPTYQQIAKNKEVLNKVIKELKLNYSAEGLANNVSVSGVDNTEIIIITVIDTNAKRACNIAGKVSEVFTEKIKEIYNASNINVLDKPVVAKSSSNISTKKTLSMSMLLGLFTGLCITVVMYFLDTTIKTSNEIENKFDVVVLGSIPLYKEHDKTKKEKVNK